MKKYKAWLIYGREDAEKNESFIKMHRETGEKLGIEIELLYADEISTTIEQQKAELRYAGKIKGKPDFVLCRTRDWLLTRQMEQMGLRVFNNSEVSLAGNHKAIAYQEAAKLSIPVVNTAFCRREYVKNQLLQAPVDAKGQLLKPLVVKTVSGHGGSQVFLYKDREELPQLLSGIRGEDVVIQPRVAGPGEDVRVYIIGNQIQGCVLRRAKEDFRANFSLGGAVEPYHLSGEEERLVKKCFERWKFDFAGIDFIRDAKGQLLFNEIEDVVGSRMYYQCYEKDILFHYLSYVRKEIEK